MNYKRLSNTGAVVHSEHVRTGCIILEGSLRIRGGRPLFGAVRLSDDEACYYLSALLLLGKGVQHDKQA